MDEGKIEGLVGERVGIRKQKNNSNSSYIQAVVGMNGRYATHPPGMPYTVDQHSAIHK